MTAIGDHLREFAALCDKHPEVVAFGTIISAGSALNFSCYAPTDEREAFDLVQRSIGGARYPVYVDDEELEHSLRADMDVA